MAVTHTTVGFKGTVDQIGEARRMARLGPRFTVADAASWVVSAATGDRTVSISAGSGQACGVVDTTTAVDAVQLEANGTSATATRYDLIIARFKWTDPVTPVAFTYVKGVPGAGASNTGGLTRTPGGQYDAVLAVVRIAGGQGTLNANDIFDCRMWNTGDGPLQAASVNGFVLAAIDASEVLDLSSGRHLRKVGVTWVKIAGDPELIYDNPNAGASGLVPVNSQPTGIYSIPLTSPIASKRGHVDFVAAVQAGSGTSVGYVRLIVNGVAKDKIFNIPTSPVSVPFSIPFSAPAGAFSIVLQIIGADGQSCFLAFSHLSVTV